MFLKYLAYYIRLEGNTMTRKNLRVTKESNTGRNLKFENIGNHEKLTTRSTY